MWVLMGLIWMFLGYAFSASSVNHLFSVRQPGGREGEDQKHSVNIGSLKQGHASLQRKRKESHALFLSLYSTWIWIHIQKDTGWNTLLDLLLISWGSKCTVCKSIYSRIVAKLECMYHALYLSTLSHDQVSEIRYLICKCVLWALKPSVRPASFPITFTFLLGGVIFQHSNISNYSSNLKCAAHLGVSGCDEPQGKSVMAQSFDVSGAVPEVVQGVSHLAPFPWVYYWCWHLHRPETSSGFTRVKRANFSSAGTFLMAPLSHTDIWGEFGLRAKPLSPGLSGELLTDRI